MRKETDHEKKLCGVFAAVLAIGLLAMFACSQSVQGPCGEPDDDGKAEAKQPAVVQQVMYQQGGIQPARLPLPGERAIDFELNALVGNDIKKIKLSDFQGKYRVLCFYPADFTFV